MTSLNIGNINIPIPIIQGGMGIGISLSGLASAVANMGGVGVISTVEIGLTSTESDSGHKQNNIDAIRREIRKARKKTTGVLGVNIMMVLSNFSDMIRTSIEEGIDIIFSGAGLPLDLPKYLKKENNPKLVPIISSARAATIICNKWKQNYNYLPDAIVIEGPKAGGHLGFKYNDIEDKNNTLEKLLSDVLLITKEIEDKYKKKIPVIASGGIYTGNDMYHIMQQGASGVQLGTRFIATEECDASPEFKNAIINASKNDIKIIKSPVGMPGRAIYNKFLQEANDGKRKPSFCKYNCIKTCDPKTTQFCIAEALLAAYNGNLTNGFVFTGSNADKVQKISTVEKIFHELMNEYQKEQNNVKSKP